MTNCAQGSPEAVAGTQWVHLERLARELAARDMDAQVLERGTELVLHAVDPEDARYALEVACIPAAYTWLYLWSRVRRHPADDPSGAAAEITAALRGCAGLKSGSGRT